MQQYLNEFVKGAQLTTNFSPARTGLIHLASLSFRQAGTFQIYPNLPQ